MSNRELRWADLSWPELERAATQRSVALFPFGAIEEHGPHLVLGADWHAADEFGRRVAEAADLLLLPALPYGQVWSLGDFPGTLSLRSETLISLVADVGAGLVQAGVRGVVLLSCHLGNMAPLKEASRRLAEKGLASLSLFYPGVKQVAASVRTTPELAADILHADEIETSILLELAPEDVAIERAVAEWPDLPDDLLSTPERWRTFAPSGVFGDPTAASKEKGALIMGVVEHRALELIASWRERHNF